MSEVRKIQIQDGKGNIYHPQTVSEQVLDLDDKLDNKADKTDVDSKLSLKADKEDVDSKLSLKADKTDMDSKLSLKADKEDVDFKLSLKADKTDMDSKLSLKADKTDMDSNLSLKADKTELNKKADKSELNNKADKSELNNKADKTELESTNNKVAELEDEVSRVESTVPKMINWDNVQKISIKKEFTVEGKGRLVKVSLNELGIGGRYALELYSIDGEWLSSSVGVIAGDTSYITSLEWSSSAKFACSDPPSGSAIWVEML